jgi:hypothetical protein
MNQKGNDCKVICEITDHDMQYYYKDQRFDQDAWDAIKGEVNEGA